MVDQNLGVIQVDSLEAAIKILEELFNQGFTEVWARRTVTGELVQVQLLGALDHLCDSGYFQKMM